MISSAGVPADLLSGVLTSITKVFLSVFTKLRHLLTFIGWVSAPGRTGLLAGAVGSAAPGRARRKRRTALTRPTFSKSLMANRFSDGKLPSGFWRPLQRALGRLRFRYRVVFLRKGDPHQHMYRAVVRFPPDELFVQLAAARRLLACVDPDLRDCSWARRLRCDAVRHPTHQDAVARLRDFRLRHQGRPLWVATLDIAALHDSIAHGAVRAALAAAVARAALRGVAIERRLLKTIEMLLASYSFGSDVVVGAGGVLAAKDPAGQLSWPLDELKSFHRDPLRVRMGLPQGSPLSDVLANLVLDTVDRAVCGDAADAQIFYARYVDNIIIAHTNRAACEAALKRATDALRELRLVPHPPCAFSLSDTAFWRAKSLAPFIWAPAGEGREWLGFLGYELRYDGEVRIRRETIRRHKNRLLDIAVSRERAFDAQAHAQGARARNWFRKHAAASVTAFERELIRACVRPGRCWAHAFPLAAFGGQCLASQARDLDRYRRLLVRRYRKHVEQHGQRLGVGLGKVRAVQDHHRASYHFNLVVRFALSVAALPVVSLACTEDTP